MKARIDYLLTPKETKYAILRVQQGTPAENYAWPIDVRLTADELRAWALQFTKAAEEMDDSLPAS